MGLGKIFKKFGVAGSSFKELINNISGAELESSTKLKYLRQVNKEVGNRKIVKKQLDDVKGYYNGIENTKKGLKQESVIYTTDYEKLGKNWKHDVYVNIETNVQNKDGDGYNKKFPLTLGFSTKEIEGIKNKWQFAEMAREKLSQHVNMNAEKYGYSSDDQISKQNVDIFGLNVTINQNRTDFMFTE